MRKFAYNQESSKQSNGSKTETTLSSVDTRGSWPKVQTKTVETIHLNQRDENGEWITPRVLQKLLGSRLIIDLTWGKHLLYREKAVIPSIKKFEITKIGLLMNVFEIQLQMRFLRHF